MKKLSKIQELQFLVMVSLFWFAQYVYIPYQTTFLTECGIAQNVIGIIIGAYGISQLLLRLPIGLLADRVGIHKPFIMIGCFSSGFASMIRVFMQGGTGFLIANLLSGLASSMWISFMVFYCSCYEKEQQQESTSRIILFNNAGMLVGFIISTLLYHYLGMRIICMFSVLGGFLACLLGLQMKETSEAHKKIAISNLLKVCMSKRIILFSVIALIQQGIQLATTMSFTTQILKTLGASAFCIGMASIVYMISSVSFAAFASSKQCARKGPSFWIPLVLICLIFYCLLVPRVNSISIIFILQILPGISTGILFSYATSEAMKGIPAYSRSTAMGFYQAIYAIGMTSFPILTGTIADKFNLKAGYLFLACIAACGCVITVLFYVIENRKEKRNEARQTSPSY